MVDILGINFNLSGTGVAHEYELVYEAPDTLFGGLAKEATTVYFERRVSVVDCERNVGSITVLEFGSHEFGSYICIRPQRLISFMYKGEIERLYGNIGSSDNELLKQLQEHLKAGEKTLAIRAVRASKHIGLREAKEWVEAYAHSLGIRL